MERTPQPKENILDGKALLSAYQLLIETTFEPEGDDVLLQRALTVLSAIPWSVPHRCFAAFVTEGDPLALHPVAATACPGAPVPLCPVPVPGLCFCSRALTQPGRLLRIPGATGAFRASCDPAGTGTHLILPLGARGRVLGALHALVDPGRPVGESELSFLVQVATLLGAELQRRRNEREHDRLEMQFLQAQKMEAVGRLAGGVAHDFNNILTTITSYADLGLLKLPADEPLRRNFNEIISAVDRATLLTQQLLAFSRQRTYAPRVIDLNTVVSELGKTLQRLLGSKFELSFAVDPEPMRIRADPALLEQLIINLMVNARDAMALGGALALSTGRSVIDSAHRPGIGAASGAQVTLALAVRGGGLSPDALLALCVPGAPAAEATVGTALGPAAVHDIIRECGGGARVDADQDGGCTLRIFFPEAASEPGQDAKSAVDSRLPGGDETVLLVEDDDSVRVVMAEILRDLGYRLLEAREGLEAQALSSEHPGRIDVLLADVALRGIGGDELWRRLAATRPGLRVLYVSGVMDEFVGAPGTVSLPKPFSPWALALRLRQVLDAPPPGPAP